MSKYPISQFGYPPVLLAATPESLSGVGVLLKPTTLATAGAQTYTAESFFTGMILRDPNGGAVSDTTPTAAAIVKLAVARGASKYSSIKLQIRNTADAAETITLLAGTGVTFKASVVAVAQNEVIDWTITIDDVDKDSEAVTMYSNGVSTA